MTRQLQRTARRWALRSSALIALAACQAGQIEIEGDDSGSVSTTTDTTTTTTPTTTTATNTYVTTTGTATGPCASIPGPPQSHTVITGIPTSEEFTFDTDGYLLNINDSADLLYRSDSSGNTEVIAPYSSSEVAAVRLMVDGDLVVADEGSGALKRMSLDGSIQPLLGNIIEPNSITIHPDGWIFTTAGHQVMRVDPEGLVPAEVLISMPGHDLDGLTFSPGFDWFYFNSDDTGRIYKAAVTPDVRLEPATQIVDLQEGNEQLDGMTVDECGSLYVVFTDGRMRRIDPMTGVVQFLPQLSGWTTSIHFGLGVGGWATDHLYVMDRNGGIIDIPIGINGMWEPHHPGPRPSTTP